MSETAETTAVADALSGTTHSATDIVFCTIGDSAYYTEDYQKEAVMLRILGQLPSSLRVFKDGDLTFGVRAGYFLDGDTLRTYAGADAQALTDDATNYIYLTSAGVLTVNTTGFPTPSATPHVRLATILTASSVYNADTSVTDYRSTSAFGVARGAGAQKFVLRTYGTFSIDGDFVHGGLVGLGVTGDMTQTEAAAAFCKCYNHDDTSYVNLATSSSNGAYTANYQLFPDVPAENDAVYFIGSLPFCQIAHDIDTAAVYNADSVTWEYWNGSAWSAQPIAHDYTDSDDQDGDRPFQRDGAVQFVPQSAWASTTVDSQAGYAIRARCPATVNFDTVPTTNSVEHYICSPVDGFRVPCHCSITNFRLTDEAATLHTATDIKFCVHNFTKGTTSAEMTFAQDKRMDAWSGDSMECDAGDILWPLVTQKDGTNEAANVTIEMDATVL